jgi:hypothetical protein
MNSNMFAETIYVPEILPTLASFGRGVSPEYAMQSQLMAALKTNGQQLAQGCVAHNKE